MISAVTFAAALCDFQTQSSSVYGDPFHLVLVVSHSSCSSHDLCMSS
jgi:hypothetical protein